MPLDTATYERGKPRPDSRQRHRPAQTMRPLRGEAHHRRPCRTRRYHLCRRRALRQKRHARRRGPQAPWQRQDNRCHGQYLRRHCKSRRRRGRLHRPRAVPLYTDQRKIIAHARHRGLSQHHGPMCRCRHQYSRRGHRRHHRQ